MKKTIGLLLLAIALWGCQPSPPESASGQEEEPDVVEANPPARGFNATASDERAISIADSAMLAMGGRRAWNNTHYLQWTFFGRRTLLWDKFTGDVRIEIPADSTIYIVNIRNLSGKAMEKGQVVENPDTLEARMGLAKSIWINDSYWLVMPFKLKDSGVTLKYLGQEITQAGEAAYKLQLTFEKVGDTPENKYHVYVDTNSYLVRQWAYFSKAGDEKPGFISPWDDYRQYGKILLSSSRGERGMSNIKVSEEAPDGAFSSLEFMLGEQG